MTKRFVTGLALLLLLQLSAGLVISSTIGWIDGPDRRGHDVVRCCDHRWTR